MKILFTILGLLAWLVSFITFTPSITAAAAATVFQQIFAAILGVTGAVLLGTAAIIDAVNRLEAAVRAPAEKKTEPDIHT